MKTAEYWIRSLDLAEHPEGGYFRETYRSREVTRRECLPDRYCGDRTFSTAIYYLLKEGDRSALHRIKSDELWHYYSGSPLELYCIDPVGVLTVHVLGRDPGMGEVFQAAVTHGCWFGARVKEGGDYSLIGCTVAPGFDFSDFEIGSSKELLRQFPEHETVIGMLS